MKSTTLALTSLLASAVIAQPHRQHQHQHQHVKKDVVWVTDWVSVTETVDYTTTVWVDGGNVPPTGGASQPSSSSVAVASSTPTQAGAQFYQPASKASSSSSSTSSSAYVAPVSPPSAPPQAQSSSSSTSVYVPPTTTSLAYTAPASTSAAAPAAQSSSSGGGSSHGGQVPTSPQPGSGHNGIGTGIVSPTCGIAGKPDCGGDITYYEAADDPDAPGTCGIANDGTTELVVAVPVGMMGSQSNQGKGDNANPYCGKKVTVEYGGKSVVATVVDKCGGCAYEDLDLSHAAFSALTPDWQTLGRQKATWYFN